MKLALKLLIMLLLMAALFSAAGVGPTWISDALYYLRLVQAQNNGDERLLNSLILTKARERLAASGWVQGFDDTEAFQRAVEAQRALAKRNPALAAMAISIVLEESPPREDSTRPLRGHPAADSLQTTVCIRSHDREIIR